MTVDGVIAMTQQNANLMVRTCNRIELKLLGFDLIPDPGQVDSTKLLLGPFFDKGQMWAAADGLHYHSTVFNLGPDLLDEDPVTNVDHDGVDEYVLNARYVNCVGHTLQQASDLATHAGPGHE